MNKAPSSLTPELVEQSVAAYQGDDKARASELLALALKSDLKNEKAWLWLSGVVRTDGERLFCLKRILAINPQRNIARRGLSLLPSNLEPAPPSFPRQGEADANACTFPGCWAQVSRSGFQFCYKHWKAISAPLASDTLPATLNPTTIGERLGLSM